MSYQSQLAELKSIIEKIEYYKYTTNSLIYWDKITYMPKNAIGYRNNTRCDIPPALRREIFP